MSEDPGGGGRTLRRTPRVKRELPEMTVNVATEVWKDDYAAAAAAHAKGDKRSNVAGFLSKAYQIFDNPAWSDVCGWGKDGETVVIHKQVEFAQRILPLYFNHANLQSFVRQLNMYNFRKVVQDPNSGEFRHDLFRQGNEHLLHLIKRKQSPGTSGGVGGGGHKGGYHHAKQELGDEDGDDLVAAASVTEKATAAGSMVQEADSVLNELIRLREWQKEMENTVQELKRDNQTLQSENNMLKGKISEHANQQLVLQGKMQKILFCMYDMYMTGLRGAAAVSGANNDAVEGDASSTDIVNAENGGGEVDRVRRLTSGMAIQNLSLASGAGGALERALQQLAALGGESMANRINLLDMENPWSIGGGGAGGAGSGSNEGGSPSASPNANKGTIVGGGALARNRTWSQSSYEWLRSLRDPDPLGSIQSPAGNAMAGSSSAAGSATGETTETFSGNGLGTSSPDRPAKRQRMGLSSAAGGTLDGVGVPPPGAAPSTTVAAANGTLEETAKIERTGVAGTDGGDGQVWGGGELTRTLSEGATQVVSELCDMENREGQTLSKIDSLGYQLAQLLDSNEPIMTLDDMSVFGEGDGGSLGPLSGGGSGTNEEALSPFPYPSHELPTEPLSAEKAGDPCLAGSAQKADVAPGKDSSGESNAINSADVVSAFSNGSNHTPHVVHGSDDGDTCTNDVAAGIRDSGMAGETRVDRDGTAELSAQYKYFDGVTVGTTSGTGSNVYTVVDRADGAGVDKEGGEVSEQGGAAGQDAFGGGG